MKTRRISRSQTRKAMKVIAYRGGSSFSPKALTEDHRIVSGRRLRRAARSGRARLEAFVTPDGGTRPGPPMIVTREVRALLGCRVS